MRSREQARGGALGAVEPCCVHLATQRAEGVPGLTTQAPATSAGGSVEPRAWGSGDRGRSLFCGHPPRLCPSTTPRTTPRREGAHEPPRSGRATRGRAQTRFSSTAQAAAERRGGRGTRTAAVG